MISLSERLVSFRTRDMSFRDQPNGGGSLCFFRQVLRDLGVWERQRVFDSFKGDACGFLESESIIRIG